jgi:hypothetical protein
VIVNIVKGRGITGALAYAMGQGENEDGKRIELAPGEKSRAEILGGQNIGFEIETAADLDLARRMMEWNGKEENQASRGRKCELDCLHMSLSWEPGQNPTRAEMVEAARGSLKALGMEAAQAVFVAHDDTAHKHLHIVASRIDPATGKTFSQANDHILAEIWSLRYEREHGQIPQNEARQKQHRIMDAVEARDGAAVAEIFTERVPTFTARELDKALVYSGLTKEERTAFRSQILGDDNVIGLRETQQSPVTRYTTREALAAEMDLLRDARALAGDKSHGVDGVLVDAASAAFTLKPEQDKALRGLTGEAAFAMLLGEAGTGKSYTLKAVRAVYESAEKDVRGLAPTHSVVGQMQGDGFQKTGTVAAALKAMENGRTGWTRNTVLIVDEAAMLSTKDLAALAAGAREAGAKLILAGDDKQLASIERGGMFETLRQHHGAAVLKEVWRVKDAEQQAAFNKMHEGEFLRALQTFEKNGGIHWMEKQADTVKDMAARCRGLSSNGTESLIRTRPTENRCFPTEHALPRYHPPLGTVLLCGKPCRNAKLYGNLRFKVFRTHVSAICAALPKARRCSAMR